MVPWFGKMQRAGTRRVIIARCDAILDQSEREHLCNHLSRTKTNEVPERIEPMTSEHRSDVLPLSYRELVAVWPYTRFIHHTFGFVGSNFC